MKNKWIIIAAVVGLCSCRPHKQYPIEPVLEFESIVKIDNGTGIDDEAVLTVSFTDGDGDLGWDEYENTDTSSENYYNYFITYFEKQNGVWVTPEGLENNFHVRLPRFLSGNITEAIDGKIAHTVNINNYNSEYDTIHFECYVVDRAGHKSNVVTTPEVIVKKY